jgi:hypothetical protein
MKSLAVVLLLAVSSVAQSAPTVAQLVGTWKLVSIEDTLTNGTVGPSAQLGPHPRGFIMYEPDGYMCATIVNSDRSDWKDRRNPSDAEKILYYNTLIAYCGSYELDSSNSTVTHHPEVAWTPSYVGSTQTRPFKLEGNQLVITVTKGFTDPSIAKRVLVWQKAN